MPGGGETGGVGHLAPRNEGKTSVLRKSENLLEPAPCDLFDDGGRGRSSVDSGVLVPSGGEPVGRERAGHRAADDPAEEPSASRANEASLHVVGQFADHPLRGKALFQEGPFEAASQRRQIVGGPDGAAVERVHEGHRLFERRLEGPPVELLHVSH